MSDEMLFYYFFGQCALLLVLVLWRYNLNEYNKVVPQVEWKQEPKKSILKRKKKKIRPVDESERVKKSYADSASQILAAEIQAREKSCAADSSKIPHQGYDTDDKEVVNKLENSAIAAETRKKLNLKWARCGRRVYRIC